MSGRSFWCMCLSHQCEACDRDTLGPAKDDAELSVAELCGHACQCGGLHHGDHARAPWTHMRDQHRGASQPRGHGANLLARYVGAEQLMEPILQRAQSSACSVLHG